MMGVSRMMELRSAVELFYPPLQVVSPPVPPRLASKRWVVAWQEEDGLLCMDGFDSFLDAEHYRNWLSEQGYKEPQLIEQGVK